MPLAQATVARAVPGSVLVPIRQFHVTLPAALVGAEPSPLASLAYPLGKTTESVQISLARDAWALSVS